MRHLKSGRKLNRTSAHRRADFRNLSISLIEHELIETTLAKAKELRRFFEPLVTIAKSGDTVANRRLVFNRLRSRSSVTKLFAQLAPRFKSRQGGYMRILKNGFRPGDNAPKAVVELLDRGMVIESDNSDGEEAA